MDQSKSVMRRFETSITKALEAEAWYSVLALTLCIPDICIGLENQRGHSKYADWFETYMPTEYHDEGIAQLSGSDCYALRCAYLHDGSQNIEEQRAREVLDDFLFVADRSPHREQNHLLRSSGTLQIELHCFSRDMLEALSEWWIQIAERDEQVKSRFEKIARIQVM